MKLARQLEQRMEHLVEGLSAAVFRGRVHPMELADRLVRRIDRSVVEEATDPRIPNAYVIRIRPSELPDQVDRRQLNHELANVVEATARDRGWRTGGPVTVSVVGDDSVGHGRIVFDESNKPGVIAPWGRLIAGDRGEIHDLHDNRVTIGRDQDQDVVLTDARVSRRHALIIRRHGSVFLMDAGSANGTFHKGQPATAEAELATGDQVTFGPVTYMFKEL